MAVSGAQGSGGIGQVSYPELLAGQRISLPSVIYRGGNTGECGTKHLERHRAVATRFGQLAVLYLATLHIAAKNLWLDFS